MPVEEFVKKIEHCPFYDKCKMHSLKTDPCDWIGRCCEEVQLRRSKDDKV